MGHLRRRELVVGTLGALTAIALPRGVAAGPAPGRPGLLVAPCDTTRSWMMFPRPFQDAPPGALPLARTGGYPRLPQGVSWPRCLRCHRPTYFVIDLERRLLPGEVKSGRIQIFYCTDAVECLKGARRDDLAVVMVTDEQDPQARPDDPMVLRPYVPFRLVYEDPPLVHGMCSGDRTFVMLGEQGRLQKDVPSYVDRIQGRFLACLVAPFPYLEEDPFRGGRGYLVNEGGTLRCYGLYW